MSNRQYNYICQWCGKEYKAKTSRSKYCSRECNDEAYKKRMRDNYSGKREKVCRFCGKELPKNKTFYCSSDCKSKYSRTQKGLCQSYEVKEKACPICGTIFETYRQRRTYCSTECGRKAKAKARPYDPEKGRIKYIKAHPNARTKEEIHEAALKRQHEKEERRKAREEERLLLLAEKERKKKANIAYWKEYEQEHTCVICGEKYIAHFPRSKYCSDRCRRKTKPKQKKRYKGITADSGITLRRLSERDHNQCQICGLLVDWDDFAEIDGNIICGNMYPSIDHITPISLGGLHEWNNIQLAHRICNSVKGNQYIG